MTASLTGKHVLVLEDEVFIGANLQAILEQAGATVELTNTSEEARQAIAASAFDAAILDVHLQDGSTYAIADQLREKGAPFVFLSGYMTVREGYTDVPFLAKPFEPDQVIEAIGKLLVQPA